MQIRDLHQSQRLVSRLLSQQLKGRSIQDIQKNSYF